MPVDLALTPNKPAQRISTRGWPEAASGRQVDFRRCTRKKRLCSSRYTRHSSFRPENILFLCHFTRLFNDLCEFRATYGSGRVVHSALAACAACNIAVRRIVAALFIKIVRTCWPLRRRQAALGFVVQLLPNVARVMIVPQAPLGFRDGKEPCYEH
jgi:hypothetical protein